MPKSKTPTQTGLTKSFRGIYTDLPGQYGGYTSTDVSVRVPRAYTTPQGRRTQFLTHLATVLKGYYDTLKNKSEIEIQVALIDGGRWLIACNKDSTTKHFYDDLVQRSVSRVGLKLKNYAEQLEKAVTKSTANDRFRKQRHAKKLKSELHGIRRALGDEGLSREISGFYLAGHQAAIAIDAVNDEPQTVIDFCTGALAGKSIALVTAEGKDWHAEQKILYALVRTAALHNLSITFSGTFRPCRGCYETLEVVKKYYMANLRFGDHPGRYWSTTDQCHVGILKLLKQQGRVSDDTFEADFSDHLLNPRATTTHVPQLRMKGGNLENELHYASESDSDFDDDDWSDSEQ